MIVKQLRVGTMDVFTYILGCEATREALVIDPGGEEDRIVEEARRERLQIKYILNTHGHWDHTIGNDRLKLLTGASIVRHEQEPGPDVDILLVDEKPFQLGELVFTVFHTPGHTPGGVCLYAEGQLFTGDTLFVGDSGRTDLPGGHRPTLGASIRRLMELPDETIVWPGHDYGPTTSSTIGWEKRHNVNAGEYGYYVANP
ncbi:MAG: MBL fold metallo-hydrolase [Desulfobacterota bacterium]|jgi:glyoxylase-like metal-dependent hydrolase (beta-lactamase superfamily II)|nr:MBL fold metallo-hydrolase [Thermodesulfobacteriota bacterium]